MELWQIRMAEQNAFHWSVISTAGVVLGILGCLWSCRTLSATTSALLILIVGTAGYMLNMQAGMALALRRYNVAFA